MKRINLRDHYPFYAHDNFIELEDIIASTIKVFERYETAYRKRMNRHKAYFSLNRDDGIENTIMVVVLTPPEIYEQKLKNQELSTALNKLSDIQLRRIYTHYFLGLSKYAIAKIEGVDESSVRKSIESGLRRMAVLIKST